MKKYIYLGIVLMSNFFYAQIGVGTNNPEAALDVKNDTYGTLFIPRTSLTSIGDKTTIVNPDGTSLAESTLIYNDGLSGLKPEGFYYWSNNNDSWICMTCKNDYGDVTYSLKTTDFEGWYLLDGRSITSLPDNAKMVAQSLGMTTNLPNTLDKVLKGKTPSETITSSVGSNTISISQANLPNIDFTGTTSSTGNHNHTGTTSSNGNHSHSYTDRGNSTVNANYDNRGDSGTIADDTSSSYTTGTDGNHNHTLDINAGGNHNHTATVNSGGGNTTVNSTRLSLVTNVFIYLGEK